MDDIKESVFQMQQDYEHMNSQRVWQHTQGLHRSEPDGVPVQRWEGRLDLPSPSKKLTPISNHKQKKITFSKEVSMGK